uniref:Uncharacterized protein n=1 Tax=Entomoneis paludosa TaxID=265537 RepID=A0A7S2YJA5_9STRA|mmetsp:Transcript_35506/g.73930  ORF Transcript_35506/g.73930 Transcript_35506/m.73930 type:complete len:358 (+) Transcript_35506:107-1180(+)|eukprot:CAMPEP_0172459610 /NCGR_PEP_ID=MMETSP1065-20121228/33366_1 /TAXON_ID=265537 /ORGANISM="Amphiprora paludosa, Strain CCMP125" /LENGTH=357 /DNA_ID=CAMNT_0013214353 /DNA_START=78 /DNA_END=1151 /DNA_ORIENTATION=+
MGVALLTEYFTALVADIGNGESNQPLTVARDDALLIPTHPCSLNRRRKTKVRRHRSHDGTNSTAFRQLPPLKSRWGETSSTATAKTYPQDKSPAASTPPRVAVFGRAVPLPRPLSMSSMNNSKQDAALQPPSRVRRASFSDSSLGSAPRRRLSNSGGNSSNQNFEWNTTASSAVAPPPRDTTKDDSEPDLEDDDLKTNPRSPTKALLILDEDEDEEEEEQNYYQTHATSSAVSQHKNFMSSWSSSSSSSSFSLEDAKGVWASTSLRDHVRLVGNKNNSAAETARMARSKFDAILGGGAPAAPSAAAASNKIKSSNQPLKPPMRRSSLERGSSGRDMFLEYALAQVTDDLAAAEVATP